MNGIICIPYTNTDLNNDKFDYKGNAFDYIEQLNGVANNIIGADTYFQRQENYKNTVGFNSNINKQENYYSDQILYYELPCNLMDSEGNSQTIDNLLNYFASEESFMLIFSFDYDNTDEEILIELKSWISESKKVMDLPDNVYSEEIKIGALPKREFKLKIGKANAFLEECLFFDSYDNKIVLFVKKIIFYN